VEAGRLERAGQCRTQDVLAIGPLDREPAEGAFAHGQSQRVDGGLQRLLVGAEGQQGATAALDVQHECTVDEHHECARLASRPVSGAAGVCSSGLVGSLRPRQRSAVRVCRVAGCQRERAR
jgi:hypothetical protein